MDAPLAYALVEPRAVSPASGETLPLVDIVVEHIYSETKTIRLVGKGKSAALSHLAARLRDHDGVRFLDHQRMIVHSDKFSLTVFDSPGAFRADFDIALEEWSKDDFIEYLIAKAPSKCRSVMNRLTAANDFWLGNGSPLVISTLLDHMIEFDELNSMADAIRFHYAQTEFEEEAMRPSVIRCCLKLLYDDAWVTSALNRMKHPRIPDQLISFLASLPTRMLLAADDIVQQLIEGNVPVAMNHRWSADLLDMIADGLINTDNEANALSVLERLANQANSEFSSNAAGVLFRINREWMPTRESCLRLDGARLAGVIWNRVTLEDSNLSNARMDQSEFRTVSFKRSTLSGANFQGSQFAGGRLDKIKANKSNFSNAVMSRVYACQADFGLASLRDAILEFGDFTGASFVGADLGFANLNFANLESADLCGALLDHVTLLNACLDNASLEGIDLRTAEIQGASFCRAKMRCCNLESLSLCQINFMKTDLSDALLTDSRFDRCNLAKVMLVNAKLADVNWTGCNLRGAKLVGCHFFYGSTRSGLVGSPYPSHGTRTGFYTDDYDDQYFKRPEEIRKANLCNCDLRGADVFRTDFYLVDLRGALFDDEQKSYFKACGAILSE